MVRFIGLSPKQTQAIEVLKGHISLPDVEVAVTQSDQASSLSRVRKVTIN
ncbi:glycosyl hydrolase-like protein [Streptococcus pneumoniae]|nr:glycosyl hydrolase-like protein [Streptococcus pneumoniae]